MLAEDSLSGKATHPFSKMYDVNASDGDINVTHDRPDLTWLTTPQSLLNNICFVSAIE